MTAINLFTTREQYLAFRAAWKAEYKNLSIAIRTLKNAIAELQQGGGYAGTQQGRLIDLRAQASDMLENLMAVKIRAGLLRENPKLTGDDLTTQIEVRKEALLAKREEQRLSAKAAHKALIAEKILKKKSAPTLEA